MGRGRFPGLDGLRFYAALGVAIMHAEQAASIFGVANVYSLIYTLGDTCVSAFFVLSGFLITFLLLDEFESGGVGLLNFYARRALRIWPVYFALIFIAFFILPAIPAMQVPGYDSAGTTSWWESFSLYMIFAPHVAGTWLPAIPFAGVLWSIGVEEWFYSVWPLVIREGLRPAVSVAAIIAIAWVGTSWLPRRLPSLMGMLRFDCMAIGALFAALTLHEMTKPLLTSLASIFRSRQAQIVVLAALPFTLARQDHLSQAIIFGALIFNLATNRNSLLKLNAPIYRHLGALSYSMYAFNWIAAVIAMRWLSGIADFTVAIVLTFLFAHLSYYVIERPFLTLQRHFRAATSQRPENLSLAA